MRRDNWSKKKVFVRHTPKPCQIVLLVDPFTIAVIVAVFTNAMAV